MTLALLLSQGTDVAAQDTLSTQVEKPDGSPSPIDDCYEQILLRRHHSLCWFVGGVCRFELVTELVDSCLLIGVLVKKLLEDLVARYSCRRQVFHVAIQMIYEFGGGRDLSRLASVCGGV